MEIALTVIGGLMSLAGGVLGYPLAEMIYDFQHWSIKNDLSNARKMIDKYEAKLEDATEGKSFTNNYYLTGSLYGLFTTQRRENYEDRNTKPLSLILVVTGSLLAIAGALAQ